MSTNPTEKPTRQVTYFYSLAFSSCFCGKPITLAQSVFSDPTYKGSCGCGLNIKLRDGKIWETNGN
jgi:hypothetical protein